MVCICYVAIHNYFAPSVYNLGFYIRLILPFVMAYGSCGKAITKDTKFD